MVIRKAGLKDIDTLIDLRIGYLVSDLGLIADNAAPIRRQLRGYFRKHIDIDLIAALAHINGRCISTAFLVISEMPANPSFITGIIGTMLNVYTLPEYRRRGIATQVIRFLIDEAAQRKVSRIDLNASPEGIPLYRSLGFTEPDPLAGYIPMKLRLH